jgi:hypothetical protein
MIHLVANPAILLALSACVLGAGFMVYFLVALTLEQRRMRAEYAICRPGLHSSAGVASVDAPYFEASVNSAHLAIGVVRITTALASDVGRDQGLASVDRLRAMALSPPRQELGFTVERRYRSV